MPIDGALLTAVRAPLWGTAVPVRERGDPPYPYPATHKDGTAPNYDVKNEKDGIVDGKIKCSSAHLSHPRSALCSARASRIPHSVFSRAACTWCRTRTTTRAGR